MKPAKGISKRVAVLLSLLVLSSVMGVVVVRELPGSAVASAASSAAATPSPDLPYREISGDIESPNISFIDSPSPTCSRPTASTGACYIQWDYLAVSAASGSYIISMTVAIDNQMRAYHSGFFQTSMYIPAEMTAPGYQVTCGTPGSGGTPEWGHIYAYTIRARETSGLSAANYGSVTCPADTVRVFLPAIQK
jgi:hypothetical protein